MPISKRSRILPTKYTKEHERKFLLFAPFRAIRGQNSYLFFSDDSTLGSISLRCGGLGSGCRLCRSRRQGIRGFHLSAKHILSADDRQRSFARRGGLRSSRDMRSSSQALSVRARSHYLPRRTTSETPQPFPTSHAPPDSARSSPSDSSSHTTQPTAAAYYLSESPAIVAACFKCSTKASLLHKCKYSDPLFELCLASSLSVFLTALP